MLNPHSGKRFDPKPALGSHSKSLVYLALVSKPNLSLGLDPIPDIVCRARP